MVSPVIPAIARRVVDRSPSSSSRVYDIGSMEGSGVGEIVEEDVVVGAGEHEVVVEEEMLYVAVGKEVKESRSALVWAVQNSEGKRICLLHVLVPSATIPMMGAEVPASSAKAQVVRAHRESERQNMHKALNVYHRFCMKMGAQTEKLFVESDSIENGLMELIQRHGIKNLVMGAASDRRYKRNMTELKSKKAIFLKSQAPASCIINFICNGHVILKREGSAVASEKAVPSLPVPPSIIIPDVEPPSISRPTPTTLPSRNDSAKFTNPVQDIFSRVFPTSSERRAGRTSTCSLPDSPVRADSRANDMEAFTRRSLSHGSAFSSSSSSSGDPDIITMPVSRSVVNDPRSWSIPEHVNCDQTSASILDGGVDDSFLDQLEQAIDEAEKAKHEALLEAVRRGKAEKDVIEAVRKVKSLETLYSEEHRKRIDVEDSLAKEEEDLGGMKNQLEEVKEEILLVSEQKLLLQRRLEETAEIMREMEQKIVSAVVLLQTYKEERDKLQFERDNALREAEELRRNQGNFSGSSLSQYYTEFPFPEIVEATQKFHPSLKIGEGGYGSIFKGSLRHTTVAIKVLHEQGMQGPKEFQQEVDVLSKVRHPNLVALIGACPEAWALVYEYLPNGSLEDRLSCRGNTMPLSWKTRIRIAAELCSALVFLHSTSPQSIVHGDLKPGNVLLDAHLVSKLSDFGICRFISRNVSSSNNTTLLYKTENPRGTLQYMDPEFLSSGELSTKSDVYSFGVILLRLLTGKSALGIIKEVQNAIESGNLKSTLDPLAGDWPYLQAEQLARLALRCCDMNRKNRPDLGSDVWRLLEPMRASCGGFSCFFDDRCQPPLYFICPILQEVMRDPHVAADGFTYEAEALRGWLESGHNTSPMTNELLSHRNLVPNRTLRTAIQEWLQNQKENLQ